MTGQIFTASSIRTTLVGTSGADTFNGSEAGDILTGGAGADVFHFAAKPWDPSHITDFTVGADKLDLSDLLKAVGYAGSDPIADQYIRFMDNGAGGTKVLFDRDGAATGQLWPDRILELDNLAYNPANAGQMLAAFATGGTTPQPSPPPVNPPTTGSGSAGQVISATQIRSILAGGAGADTFNGSEAGDTLTGGGGADLFRFASKPWDPSHITDFQVGVDKLDLSALLQQVGYTGADPIADQYIRFMDNGAGGTKVLFDRDGAATGQLWPDRILELDNLAYNPANAAQILGASVSGGGSTGGGATGGGTSGGGTAGGGTGAGGTGGTNAQVFTASGAYSTLTGTGGADTFNGSEAGDTITGGAGGDVFHFAKKPWDPSHITDFQVGSDKLDLSDLLKAVGYTGSDPIADKYIAFADNGAGGTKVLFDRDGAGTAQQWPDRILELDKLAYNPANASQMLLGSTSGGGTTTPPPASPTIALTTTSVTLAEGASGSTAFAYTLTRTGASTGASSVHWAVTGSGTNGASASDFTGGVLPQGDVTFAAGETSKTITVNVAGDTAVETDEAFTVTLSNVSGATLGTATASGLITNDDTASGGGGTGGGPLAGGGAGGAFVLFAGQSNTGGNYTTASQVDADWRPDPLTQIWNSQTHAWEQIVPGQNTGWSNGGLAVSWGPEVEYAIQFRAAYPTEKLYILKQADGGTTLAYDWDPDLAGRLFDNVTRLVQEAGSALGGRKPDVLFWGQGETDGYAADSAQAYGANLTEFVTAARNQWLGDVNGKIALFRIGTSPPLSVQVRQGQLAVDQADANVTSFDTLSFPLQSDNLHYSASGLDMVGASYFDVYAGWRGEPRVGLTTSAVYKDEGQSGSTAFSYTLTRTGDVGGALSVNWAVTGSGSNAANGADFAGGALPGGTVTFAAGETSRTITFNAAGDTAAEASERFTLTLTGTSRGLIGTATAEGIIVDDDGLRAPNPGTNGSTVASPGTYSVVAGTTGADTLYASQAGDTLTGGAGSDVFVIRTPPSTPLTFTDFAPGTDRIDISALLPANYHGDAVAELYVVTRASTTGGALVYVDPDGGALPGQNFQLIGELQGVSPWALKGSDFITGTTSGGASQLGFAISSASHVEGDSGATTFAYLVTRTGDASSSATAHWTATGSGPNAADAADFRGGVLPSGDVTFGVGETSKIVSVTVAGDTSVERDEGFTITLSNVTGASLGAATATGLIVNNDIDPNASRILTSTGSHSVLTGGGGADTLNAGQGGDTLTGGGGADVFVFANKPWEPVHITDLQFGADHVDVSSILDSFGYAGTNPIADKYVVLLDDGAGGTRILFDRDGAAVGQQWPDYAINLDHTPLSLAASSTGWLIT